MSTTFDEDNITHFMRSRKKRIESNRIFNYDDIEDLKKSFHGSNSNNKIQKYKHKIVCNICVFMAIFTSFYMIWYPSEVVFDEVHFGKYASYYLRREYFFDVHPPLGKLMFAFIGYFAGYDGHFLFDHIGDSYLQHDVPYISFRLLPATLNVASVSLLYNILAVSGYSVITCCTVAILFLFDNAFVTHNRLILLDSTMIFFMLSTVYSYIRFSKLRNHAFTSSWYLWLISTGVCMACATSVKLVGLFVMLSIGICTVKELWEMLGLKYELTPNRLLAHFLTRFICLFIMPITIYLFWFHVHFSILNQSGTGDVFMSVDFQRTLKNHIVADRVMGVHYNQSIALMNTETAAFLYSYERPYPFIYPDGRRSSRGQQVVGNRKPDLNSFWTIRSPIELYNKEQRPVRDNDIIRLEHVATGKSLVTHNRMSAPYITQNQEVTAIDENIQLDATWFRVKLKNYFEGDEWQTYMSMVTLEHILTGVSIACHPNTLPDWGAHNLEVSGNTGDNSSKENIWIAADIQNVNSTEYNLKHPKMNFFEKVIELHKVMFQANSELTERHPYQSSPYTWPLMLRGISYWLDINTKSQIYLVGNIASWWLSIAAITLFIGVIVFDSAIRKRGQSFIKNDIRRRMIRSGGFFLLLWASHYLPFFIMGRSLFLHHYLPAMTYSYLIIGAVFQYLFVDDINSPIVPYSYISFTKNKYARIRIKSYIASFIMIAMQFTVFVFLAPLTYGTSNLSHDSIVKRKVLESWDINFAIEM